MKILRFAPFGSLLLIVACAAGLAAQTPASDYLTPFPPHHVVGNIYFVGSEGLGIYLIVTPDGNILINAGLEDSVPLIQQSVQKLGLKFSDTKILLISHAHFDHDAGSAAIVRMTGAKYMVMEGDVPVVESGGKADFFYGNTPSDLYPPAKVDRVLHDGDTVTLGGATLVAHLTAGHTKDCTTWTMTVEDGGKRYNVVIVGSPNVNPGYKLVDNTAYPQIADDYARGFRVLKSLPCDIFLGAHGAYFGLEEKYPRLKSAGAAAFVDPQGYAAFVAEREQAFTAELAKQRRGAGGPAASVGVQHP